MQIYIQALGEIRFTIAVPEGRRYMPYSRAEKPMACGINPFSGEFIITMSHLPGRVLNFKIPRARPFY